MSGIFHYLEKSLSCVQLSTFCDATTWVIETKLNTGQNWLTEPNFLRSKSKPHPSVTSAYEQMIHLEMWTDFTDQYCDILWLFETEVDWWCHF